jgi:hypothetical protein
VSTDQSPRTSTTNEHQVLATPAQLFAGLALGLPSMKVVCAHCHTRLREGDKVSVYAYRPVEDAQWYLGRRCCLDCAPARITTPTLGTAECRLTARLVVQSDVTEQGHRLVLADPELKAFTPPADGTPS